MNSAKIDLRCVVCDMETTSLCELHKHQSITHSSEELSLSVLTLQSFIYHKHYFQKLDDLPMTNVCYFYPFCTQLFSETGKTLESTEESGNSGQNEGKQEPEKSQPINTKQTTESSKGKETPQSSKIKETPGKKGKRISRRLPKLRLPLNNNDVAVKSKNTSTTPPSSEKQVFSPPSTEQNLDDIFYTSAIALCDDLVKLKNKNKLKCKRLTERKDRPRSNKGNKQTSKQMIPKPPRKPRLAGKNNNEPKTPNNNVETLQIWASPGEDSTCNTVDTPSGITEIENLQQVRLKSPTVPPDFITGTKALVYNPESGMFQWNPLFYVEKTSEGALQLAQQMDSVVAKETVNIDQLY